MLESKGYLKKGTNIVVKGYKLLDGQKGKKKEIASGGGRIPYVGGACRGGATWAGPAFVSGAEKGRALTRMPQTVARPPLVESDRSDLDGARHTRRISPRFILRLFGTRSLIASWPNASMKLPSNSVEPRGALWFD